MIHDFKAGDRVVVRGVPRGSREWDIGTVQGNAGNGTLFVHWHRANETFQELPSELEHASALDYDEGVRK